MKNIYKIILGTITLGSPIFTLACNNNSQWSLNTIDVNRLLDGSSEEKSEYFIKMQKQIKSAVSLNGDNLTVDTGLLPDADEFEKFVFQIGVYSKKLVPFLESAFENNTAFSDINKIKKVIFQGTGENINLDIFKDVHADVFDFSSALKLKKIIGRGMYYSTKKIIFPTNGVLKQIGSNVGLQHNRDRLEPPFEVIDLNLLPPTFEIHHETIKKDIRTNKGFINSPFARFSKDAIDFDMSEITIPASVRYIYGPAFANLVFKNLIIAKNSNLEYIGYKAFYNSRLNNLDLTNATKLRFIGEHAFGNNYSNNSLLNQKNVKLPQGLTFQKFATSFK